MRMRTWALALSGALALGVGSGWAQQPAGKTAAPLAAAPQLTAGKPAALVNGEAITLAHIDNVINRDGPKAVQIPDAKLREMRHGALAMMIDNALWQQYIRKTCPPAKPDEINQKLAELAEGLKKSGKTFEQFCQEAGETAAEVKEDVSNMLQWRDFVLARATDAEVQRYYTENKDFFDGVTVKTSHIVIRVAPEAPDAEKQAARAKLAALRQEIVTGKLEFGEAAKKHSQCPSGPTGGDLGFIPRKFMVDETFARTAFALKVNDVSDVVQTEFGFHLIKATERKAGQASDFAKIKEEVREVYALELRNAIVLMQRKASKIEVNLP